jgi:DNA-binding transcriptional MerR regulator
MSQAPTSKPVKGEMTIHELAERTGMTVRNIRAHQTRGLLPPPVVRGRTGYYNDGHLSRIQLTSEMQADGLNLEAIRRVLEGGDNSAAEIFDFTRALRASVEDEAPEIVDVEELAEPWTDSIDTEQEDDLTRRAEALGAFRTLPDGRLEVISPRMFQAAVALAELGVKREGAMEAAEKVRSQADSIARTFIELFSKEIWQPFEEAGRPEGDWTKVRDALERLQPLASDALLATFQIAMADAVEKASEQTLRRAASPKPAPKGGKRRRKTAQTNGKPRRKSTRRR